MHNLDIKLDGSFKVAQIPVQGELTLRAGTCTLLRGENGIGKSSLFRYFKHKLPEQDALKHYNFLDQFRLSPLNDITFNQLKKELEKFSFEVSELFEQGQQLASDYLERPIRELSGGQNQMIKILITLYLGGHIFFMDEPLQYLDQTNKNFLKAVIQRLKQQNKMILLVEHNDSFLADVIDSIIEMEQVGEQILLEASNGN